MKTFVAIGITLMIVAGAAADVPPPVPNTPAAVDQVVYARPFRLDEGYKFEWCAERPLVTEGYVLVLKVNPDLVYARQALEPVLYVGNTTAERVNQGNPSGYVVAIVPGPVDKIDLSQTRIWFGTPELPERCTSNTIAAENVKAARAAIQPLPAEQVKAAQKVGGDVLRAADRYTLRRELAGLIQKYSPEEKDLINGLLVPRQ